MVFTKSVVLNGLDILVVLANSFEQLGDSCDNLTFGTEVRGEEEEKLVTELLEERGSELALFLTTFLFRKDNSDFPDILSSVQYSN